MHPENTAKWAAEDIPDCRRGQAGVQLRGGRSSGGC